MTAHGDDFDHGCGSPELRPAVFLERFAHSRHFAEWRLLLFLALPASFALMIIYIDLLKGRNVCGELYGYSGQFKPSADESNTTIVLWKFIFDEYGFEEYESIRDGMTSDFGDPDNHGDVGDISIAYWDDTKANTRKALEYRHNESLILHIYYLDHKEYSVKTESSDEASDEASPINTKNQTTTQSEKAYVHACEVDGCKNEGIHSITGFSGKAEWYCDEHYEEMEDIINRMAEDVAADSSNSYTSPSSSSGSSAAIAYDAILEYGSGDILMCSS